MSQHPTIQAAIEAAEKFCDDFNPEVAELIARWKSLTADPLADRDELLAVGTRLLQLDHQFQTLCNRAERIATEQPQ